MGFRLSTAQQQHFMSKLSSSGAWRFELAERPPRWSLLLIGAVFLGWLALIWFWPVSIYTLTVDDSYYYLKTAANAASGYGLSFDQINLTNGFHPLWMLVLIPMSWLSGGNMELFTRLALTLQLALVYMGAKLLSRAVENRSRWILFSTAVLMLIFYFTKILINGLESGLQWFCICVTLAVVVRLLRQEPARRNGWQYFGLGLLAGLAVLARLTSVLFAGGIVLLVIVVHLQVTGQHSLGLLTRRVGSLALGIALLVTPYLLWNYLSTGHLMPVSAAIKTSREFKLSGTSWLVFTTLAGMWIFSCGILWNSAGAENSTRHFLWLAFPLFTYAILQEEADIVFRGALVSEIWYMVPQALLTAVLMGAVFRQAASRSGMWRAVALAGSILLAGFAALTWYYRLDPRSYASYLAARRTADWLQENTPSQAVVGCWDAGIVGAYSNRRVPDLDGLINSWDYKTKYFDKKLTEQWITDVCKVDYLAQEFWPSQLTPEVLRDYRGVNLLKWNVVHDEPAEVRSWSNLGKPDRMHTLVLTRDGNGVPLEEYLAHLNAPIGDALPQNGESSTQVPTKDEQHTPPAP